MKTYQWREVSVEVEHLPGRIDDGRIDDGATGHVPGWHFPSFEQFSAGESGVVSLDDHHVGDVHCIAAHHHGRHFSGGVLRHISDAIPEDNQVLGQGFVVLRELGPQFGGQNGNVDNFVAAYVLLHVNEGVVAGEHRVDGVEGGHHGDGVIRAMDVSRPISIVLTTAGSRTAFRPPSLPFTFRRKVSKYPAGK